MKSLTKESLKKLIQQEAAKMNAPEDVEKVAAKTKEVDADGYADSLEKKIDMISALKIEESRTLRRLKTIRENRARIMKSIKGSK